MIGFNPFALCNSPGFDFSLSPIPNAMRYSSSPGFFPSFLVPIFPDFQQFQFLSHRRFLLAPQVDKSRFRLFFAMLRFFFFISVVLKSVVCFLIVL